MSKRTEYELLIEINGRKLTRVVIDQHYLVKHAESIDDELILDLVKSIHGETFDIDSEKRSVSILCSRACNESGTTVSFNYAHVYLR